MQDYRIRKMIIASLIIGVMVTGSCLFIQGGEYFTGAAAGAAVGTLNFIFLVLLVRRLIGEPEAPKGGLVVRFLLKYGLIGLMIAGAVFGLKVSPIGFAIGVSNIPAAILIVGLIFPAKEEK